MTDPEHKPHVHQKEVPAFDEFDPPTHYIDCPECITREAARAADKERIDALGAGVYAALVDIASYRRRLIDPDPYIEAAYDNLSKAWEAAALQEKPE